MPGIASQSHRGTRIESRKSYSRTNKKPEDEAHRVALLVEVKRLSQSGLTLRAMAAELAQAGFVARIAGSRSMRLRWPVCWPTERAYSPGVVRAATKKGSHCCPFRLWRPL